MVNDLVKSAVAKGHELLSRVINELQKEYFWKRLSCTSRWGSSKVKRTGQCIEDHSLNERRRSTAFFPSHCFELLSHSVLIKNAIISFSYEKAKPWKIGSLTKISFFSCRWRNKKISEKLVENSIWVINWSGKRNVMNSTLGRPTKWHHSILTSDKCPRRIKFN